MSGIVVDHLERRAATVRELLVPIRPAQGAGRREVATKLVFLPGAKRTAVIAAQERRDEGPYRDWLIRTCVSHVWAHYSEKWIEDNAHSWELRQAALHLFVVEGPREDMRREVFALHCEPQHEGNSISALCKRGMHVHVTAGRNELSHAHVPLHLKDLEEVLSSAEAFTELFKAAIRVIEVEVVARLG